MFIDVQQNTDDWLLLRSGKLTGSAIAKVMANYGKAFGEPAKQLASNIALEQITGQNIASTYSNPHMERGHEQEPIARTLYEDFYFCDVLNGGFFDNDFTGCSPDGLVDDNGVIEIKSVIPSQQYKRIKSEQYDSAYKWQIMFNLKESGREWLDYISFCNDYPIGKQLFIQRVKAEDEQEYFNMLDTRIAEFKELVEEIKNDIQHFEAA